MFNTVSRKHFSSGELLSRCSTRRLFVRATDNNSNARICGKSALGRSTKSYVRLAKFVSRRPLDRPVKCRFNCEFDEYDSDELLFRSQVEDDRLDVDLSTHRDTGDCHARNVVTTRDPEIGCQQPSDKCIVSDMMNTHETLFTFKRRLDNEEECVYVKGKVRITNVTMKTVFLESLNTVKSINGSLEITGNNISFIGFAQLEEILGKGEVGLSITDNPHLLDVYFPKLKKIEKKIIIKDNPLLWSKWFREGKRQLEKHFRDDSIVQSKQPYPNSGPFGDYALWIVGLGMPFITILSFTVIWLVSLNNKGSHAKKPNKGQDELENYDS
nr:EGF receptor domain containing protein [Haemonchus contortus]